jgi:hypothetical protein
MKTRERATVVSLNMLCFLAGAKPVKPGNQPAPDQRITSYLYGLHHTNQIKPVEMVWFEEPPEMVETRNAQG